MSEFIKVKNLNGTSDNNPPSGFSSWKEWWENKKGRSFPNDCSKLGCKNKPTLGAHVQKVNGGNSWYIVPLCSSCNNISSTVEFSVWDNDLQPVNS